MAWFGSVLFLSATCDHLCTRHKPHTACPRLSMQMLSNAARFAGQAGIAVASRCTGPSLSLQTWHLTQAFSVNTASVRNAAQVTRGFWSHICVHQSPSAQSICQVAQPLLRQADPAQLLVRTVLQAGQPTTRHYATIATSFQHSASHYAPHMRGALAQTAGLSDSARKQVGWWLAGCSGWVFSMVVLGGMTRLTRSGLSMTDWKFTGERPPTTLDHWHAEFDRYKQSPEFKKVNRSMTLEEFKFIYWMEYAHRMWGRALGLVFAGPAAYFAARRYINAPLAKSLGLFFLMGGTQGLVGWWMVKSGLQEPTSEWDTPRVSPYRLAAHLTSAFVIYSGLFWTSLNLFYPLSATAKAPTLAASGAAALRKAAHPLAALIGITAVSGVFVAGMDAGRAYNDFPLMNGQWIPDDYWAIPGWRGFFENSAAVQLHHRVLATTTLVSVLTTWALFRGRPLPQASRQVLNGLAAVTCLQVTLGITTLMTHVPASLGSAHQAGALTLFTLALALLHTLRRSPSAVLQPQRFVRRHSTALAAAGVLGIGATVALEK